MTNYEVLWLNLKYKLAVIDNGNHPDYKYQAILELMNRMERED